MTWPPARLLPFLLALLGSGVGADDNPKDDTADVVKDLVGKHIPDKGANATSLGEQRDKRCGLLLCYLPRANFIVFPHRVAVLSVFRMVTFPVRLLACQYLLKFHIKVFFLFYLY